MTAGRDRQAEEHHAESLSRVFWSAYRDHHPEPSIRDFGLLPEEDQAGIEAGAHAVAKAAIAALEPQPATPDMAALADEWDAEADVSHGGYADGLRHCADELRKRTGLPS